ncbi:COMM domain-containing protein 6 [Mactra antiquata]
MASIVKDAPEGFGVAVEILNSFNEEDLILLGSEVTQFLQYKIGAVNVNKWREKLSDNKNKLDETKLQSCINALIYIYRCSAKEKLSVEQLRTDLGTSIMFSESTLTSLCTVWSKQGPIMMSSGLSEHILGVGQLLDIQWKVGVAMCSDHCKQLNSPFVTLVLTVSDTRGNIKSHTLELTMEQFRNFNKQLKDIGRMMEMV